MFDVTIGILFYLSCMAGVMWSIFRFTKTEYVCSNCSDPHTERLTNTNNHKSMIFPNWK